MYDRVSCEGKKQRGDIKVHLHQWKRQRNLRRKKTNTMFILNNQPASFSGQKQPSGIILIACLGTKMSNFNYSWATPTWTPHPRAIHSHCFQALTAYTNSNNCFIWRWLDFFPSIPSIFHSLPSSALQKDLASFSVPATCFILLHILIVSQHWDGLSYDSLATDRLLLDGFLGGRT